MLEYIYIYMPLIGSVLLTIIIVAGIIVAIRRNSAGRYANGGFISRHPAPRPAANRPDDAKVVGPEVTSVDAAERLRDKYYRHHPEIKDAWDSRCRLGDPLPEDQAGRIDDNGNITWLVGQSLSCGIVRIHATELDKARIAGWHAVDVEGDYIVVDRSDPNGKTIEDCRARFGNHESFGGYDTDRAIAHARQLDADEDYPWCGIGDPTEDVNDEPLALPPQPNVGGEGHPEYKGPHYDVEHDQFVPYDMLSDPIPGTAVHKVGNVAVAGPIGKPNEDNKRPD